jgi:hypothetical protein
VRTVTIVIDNSDDKLSQQNWNSFVAAVNTTVNTWAWKVHFFGAPPSTGPWQNAAWVVELADVNVDKLRCRVHEIVPRFRQDSIAWIVGDTELLLAGDLDEHLVEQLAAPTLPRQRPLPWQREGEAA